MICSAVLCQTKGLGSSFQCDAHTSIASVSAATEVKLALRSRRLVSCANQPSTRFSHDELVGVKCRCQRARFGCSSHALTGGAECAERLSNTTCTSRCAGTWRSIQRKNSNT